MIPKLDDLPVGKPDYNECTTVTVGGYTTFKKEYKWYSKRPKIIRYILGDQQPHSGGSDTGSGYDEFNISFGFSRLNRDVIEWVETKFDRLHDEIPKVVCTAFFRNTKWINRQIPKFERHVYHCLNCGYAWLQLGIANACPKCGSSNITEITGYDRLEKMGYYRSLWGWRQRLGNWGAFNQVRDFMATALANFTYYTLGRDTVYEVLGEIDRLTLEAENAINERLVDLFKMWKLPGNLAIAPVHLGNVSRDGFTWLGLGKMDIHYIAISKKD